MSVPSLAIAAAQRAAHAGPAGIDDPNALAHELTRLHMATSEAAAAMGVPLRQRIDALTRALTISIDAAVADPANDDAALAILAAAAQLAGGQLQILRLNRAIAARKPNPTTPAKES